MNKIRLAVVGAGHLGRIHARLAASNDLFEVVAVADPCETARATITSSLGLKTVADYRKLSGNIDAAIVATPTCTHYEIASTLLRAGAHCLVEKPLSHDVDQARRLVQIAHRHNRILQVGHVERFNAVWTTAQTMLGRPCFVEAVRIGPFSGRSTDIGVVFDLMIHDLDLILSVEKSEIVSVSASGVALLGKQEDLAEARLEFASGTVALLRASRVATGATRRMQWYTTEGYIDIDFSSQQLRAVRLGQAIRDRAIDVDTMTVEQRQQLKLRLFEEHLLTETIEVESRNAILDEHHDFAVSIAAGQPPVVSGQTAAHVVEVADRIRKAIAARQWRAQWSPHAPTTTVAPSTVPLPSVLTSPEARRKAG